MRCRIRSRTRRRSIRLSSIRPRHRRSWIRSTLRQSRRIRTNYNITIIPTTRTQTPTATNRSTGGNHPTLLSNDTTGTTTTLNRPQTNRHNNRHNNHKQPHQNHQSPNQLPITRLQGTPLFTTTDSRIFFILRIPPICPFGIGLLQFFPCCPAIRYGDHGHGRCRVGIVIIIRWG